MNEQKIKVSVSGIECQLVVPTTQAELLELYNTAWKRYVKADKDYDHLVAGLTDKFFANAKPEVIENRVRKTMEAFETKLTEMENVSNYLIGE